MNKRHFLMFALSLASVIIGCQQATTNPLNSTSTTTPQPVTLIVSVAASMQDAIKAVKEVYTQQYPKTNITYNFAGSGTLEQQIEQGAPADVFISADSKWMDALEEKNLLLPGTRQDLLTNSIVLITPASAQNTISDFQQLNTSGIDKVAIGNPQSVPAGQYAKQVLTSFKVYNPLESQSKFVFGKDVRQVLSYVETGNVDAGLVYGTDAKVTNKVKVVATAPQTTHKPIIYPVAVIKSSKNTLAAKEFVKFLSTDKAKKVFELYGFETAK